MKFLEEAEKPLYKGCKRYTKLSALVKQYNTKARHEMSDALFSDLLADFGDMLPDNHNLPSSIYEAKKTLSCLALSHEKIHVCYNDCILYRKQYKDCVSCPKCGLSRWKLTKKNVEKKGVPAKVVWYFPPIPRFKRMFKSLETSRNLTSHADSTRVVDQLRHPVDSPSWKLVDHMWPDFGSEARNIRLALVADGINPHSNLRSRYSCWPIMLATYNLPPDMCMKRKFIMLMMLISGPKQPGNDIDVYLEVLVDDLQLLWEGVDGVYDAYRREVFTLKVVLLWTFNDFPAYGNLSGCTTHGYYGCPICGEDTYAKHLQNGKKMSFAGHRRFLPRFHPYRMQIKEFNGMEELGEAGRPLSGIKLFDKLSDITCEFGKKTSGKTKDNVAARLDMVQMGIRPQLAPKIGEKRTYLPPAACSFSKNERLQYFPPSFFDIMLHLTVHLVREVQLCGPVYFRWMYPFERCMKVLKSYVGNRKYPEGCIVRRYATEEAVEFCSEYLNDLDPVGVPKSLRDPYASIPGFSASNSSIIVQQIDLQQAHLTVLENIEEISPYIIQCFPRNRKMQGGYKMLIIRGSLTGFVQRNACQVAAKIDSCNGGMTSSLRWLAHGPRVRVLKCDSYVINGNLYQTKERDDEKVCQNSGVSLLANTMLACSAKDKNPVLENLTFYGVIEEIRELDYHQFQVPLFKCAWVSNDKGIQYNDECGFNLVNLNKRGHQKDEFVLASQVRQVFYVADPLNKGWSIVLRVPNRCYEGEEDLWTRIPEARPIDNVDIHCIPTREGYFRSSKEGFFVTNKKI
ncbi:uncharacterized protein LOC122011054 [Zingiber officinale]|uniref:uncharacterized protein LOC122011054 n=1 Tax=Zingiber officinale TaxID=94328 RepID=UPI001C4B7995|nr:uncharacterized protein LOC122011054 [Zingiber officinale]